MFNETFDWKTINRQLAQTNWDILKPTLKTFLLVTRVSDEWAIFKHSNMPHSFTCSFEYSNTFEYVESSMLETSWSSFKWPILKQNPLINGWDINWKRFTFMTWRLFQDNLNLLISQPFISGFCFNIGHLNELQLVIRMNEYPLREEIIRIF